MSSSSYVGANGELRVQSTAGSVERKLDVLYQKLCEVEGMLKTVLELVKEHAAGEEFVEVEEQATAEEKAIMVDWGMPAGAEIALPSAVNHPKFRAFDECVRTYLHFPQAKYHAELDEYIEALEKLPLLMPVEMPPGVLGELMGEWLAHVPPLPDADRVLIKRLMMTQQNVMIWRRSYDDFLQFV